MIRRVIVALGLVALGAIVAPAWAAPAAPVTPAAPAAPASALTMVAVLTIATLLPALVLSCTCFVRFVVVLGFVRTGLSTPTAPPNQVLVGLALFMTMFVSAPVATQMWDAGGQPYLDGTMTEREAATAATPPLRRFLIERTRDSDLAMFYEVSDEPRPRTAEDVPLRIAVPAFIVSELRTAFEMGLAILLPFLVIDLVVATVLTALGMVMVPPQVLSLPVKLLVFLAIDGWSLLIGSLLKGAM